MGRQYASIEEHDAALIATWNSHVSRSDVVYVIGDFSFHNYAKTKEILAQLNGQKILIRGNHDDRFTTKALLTMGFNDVYDRMLLKLRDLRPHARGSKEVVLHHYGYLPPWYKQVWRKLTGTYYWRKYFQWAIRDLGYPLIHGHDHRGKAFYKTAKGTLCYNVAWDIHKKPVAEEEIVQSFNRGIV